MRYRPSNFIRVRAIWKRAVQHDAEGWWKAKRRQIEIQWPPVSGRNVSILMQAVNVVVRR